MTTNFSNAFTITAPANTGPTGDTMSNRPDLFDTRFAGVGPEIMKKDGFSSSEQITQLAGLTVREQSGNMKGVTKTSELKGSDMINVGGLEMTVEQARGLGLDVGSAVAQHSDTKLKVERSEPSTDKSTDLRNQIDVVEKAIESGAMTREEARPVSNAYESIALNSSLDAPAAAELVKDVFTGELREHDPVWKQKNVGNVSYAEARAHASNIHRSMQNAAQKELSVEQYNHLVALAAESPTVKKQLIEFAFGKATGRGGSWRGAYNKITGNRR